MALTCRIRWIDKSGNPTPDDNEAVALCWIEPHDDDIYGRVVHIEQSDVFPICADHLVRLQVERYRHWTYQKLHEEGDEGNPEVGRRSQWE
jgi:hypothetical protein